MFNCAFDIGASGGRLMLGEYGGKTVKLTEIHRFPNEPVNIRGVLYWDAPRLFHEMKTGLKKLAAERVPLASVGIDTWGIDYALLDRDGNIVGMPVHYRDARTDGVAGRLSFSPREVYARTGIQFLPFNTLFQLMADGETRPDALNAAADLLFMPDLFTYFLTGVKINEYTDASTSQLLNAQTRDWSGDLIDAVKPAGLRRLFRPVTPPCTVIGPLTPDILAETGLSGDISVVAVGSHDTASAVAGTPLSGANGAYLSCGTWSLLGMELDAPCLTEESYAHNFTNEGGLCGTIRYLKNINGLWTLQQLLKSYNDAKYGFPDIIAAAERAERKHFRIAPNDALFTNPPDMAAAVRAYCEAAGQGTPEGMGETAVAVYNGLVNEYAAVIAELEAVRGVKIDVLHMVGGGVRDKLLCRMTAEATGKRVIAGPVEASALGNIAAQWLGLGAVPSLGEAREVIRRSFDLAVYG